MSRSAYGKTTAEEKLLRKKYRILQEKKEQVQEYMRLEALKEKEKKEKDRSFFLAPLGNYRKGATSDSKAKEEAKRLVMSGKISISSSQEVKKQSFKRASVLEKKLSEGRTLGTWKPMSQSLQSHSVGGTTNSNEVFEKRNENQEESSLSGRMQPGSSSSSAASEWRRSIETERYRKSRSAGGYFDYKRRIVTYDDDESNSEDDD